MTNPGVLREWVPGTTCPLRSEAIASTFLTLRDGQFMQLIGSFPARHGEMLLPRKFNLPVSAKKRNLTAFFPREVFGIVFAFNTRILF